MKRAKLAKLACLTLILFGILMAACQTSSQNEKEDSITIPLDISSQRPILELMLNGNGPYHFIFDTGSSGNVIDSDLAVELDLEVVGEDPLRTPGSDNELMSKRVSVPLVTFAGGDIAQDATMNTIALREMVSVDGILGPAFFSDHLIILDYAQSELILSTGQLNEVDEAVIPLVQEDGIINFEVLVDGIKVEAHLDSGNPGGIDIPFSLQDQLSFSEGPIESGVIRTPVAVFKRWQAALSGDIQIGAITYQNPDVNLIEDFVFVNLGYQILSDLRTTIDQKNGLIQFEQSLSTNDEPGGAVEDWEEENDFTGWYDGRERKIFMEDGELHLQRGNAPKLKLVEINADEYEMVFDQPVNNELPDVRFERDDTGQVVGLTFIFDDGREEFVDKDR